MPALSPPSRQAGRVYRIRPPPLAGEDWEGGGGHASLCLPYEPALRLRSGRPPASDALLLLIGVGGVWLLFLEADLELLLDFH